MVTLLFSTQKTLGSALIRFLTWSPYSHVDIVIGELVIGATASKGVKVSKLSTRLKNASKHAFYDIPDCEVASQVHDLALSQTGKGYDYMAIIGFFFRRNWEKENRWFCSELVAWCIQHAGYKLFNEKLHRIAPRDLLILPKLIKR